VKEAKKRFRVALSFAGEKREFVAQIAANLARHFGEEAILYDKYHEPEFGRARLGRYLPKLYHEETDLVVVIICRDYTVKEWPGLEWDAIFDLLKKRKDDEVMLCRFDNATVEGLFDAGYVELDQRTPAQAASAILQRLAGNEGNDRDFYITGPGSTPWKRSDSSTKQLPSTENTLEASLRSASQTTFHGLQRRAVYEKLQRPWLCNGPCVAILQGFPGCGKTQLASALSSKDMSAFAASCTGLSDATAQMFDPADPDRPVKAFLQEYQTLFGFGPEALDERSAVIYTLLGSCRRRVINPFDYLKDLFIRLPAAKITRIKGFTPAAWVKANAKEKVIAQAA
jgi:hypothetical protein